MHVHTHACACTRAHTHTRILHSTIKRNEIMPFSATWVDIEIIISSEGSQTEKDKYYMIAFICGI